MDFNHSSSMENQGFMVSWINKSQSSTESISVGMYPSLIGTFNFPSPMSYIHATMVGYQNSSSLASITRVTSFKEMYLQDPWVLSSPCELDNGCEDVGMAMP
jgi:hypothetical protein